MASKMKNTMTHKLNPPGKEARNESQSQSTLDNLICSRKNYKSYLPPNHSGKLAINIRSTAWISIRCNEA
jgi:hypothetical protein